MNPEPPPGFARADLHVHTTWSDGASTPEDVLNFYALHSGVRVLAITDHDTIDGALHARRYAASHPELFGHLDVIVAEEVTSSDGHILGLFLKDWVPPGMDAERTIEAIHRQGGIAIAAHPYTSMMRFLGLIGVGDLIRTLPFDAVEVRNSNFTEVLANRKAARRAGDKARVGCSDGHFLDAVALCYTDFPGTRAADLRNAIENRTTIAGGSCYGLPTLLRYVWTRLRTGGSILPKREGTRLHEDEGTFDLVVASDSRLEEAVLTAIGRLDVASYLGVKQTLEALTAARVPIVLDLSRVGFLDSSGITALISGLKGARQSGSGFCLADLSSPAAKTLEISRLKGIFPTARSVAEARKLARKP